MDGLRGIAALAVFVFHVVGPPLAFYDFPGARLAETVTGYGKLGVQVFFVLSGFVIAHSLREAVVTPAFFLRFVLRRSVRLDPTFWVVLLGTVTSLWVSNELDTSRTLPYPSPGVITANALYVQDLLGRPRILEVSWSLCIELQLYVVFVCALGVLNRTPRGWRLPAIGALVGASLYGGFLAPLPVQVWFVSYFYLFLLGALVAWHGVGRLPVTAVLVALGAVLAVAVLLSWPAPAVGATTGAALLVAQRAGGLASWLTAPIFQFLGRISYSFYLTHTIVASRLHGIARRMVDLQFANSLAFSGVILVFSIAAAWLVYRLVEAPSMGLARRIPLGPRVPLVSKSSAAGPPRPSAAEGARARRVDSCSSSDTVVPERQR